MIRHEGRVVCESDDIVEYLDTAFPTAGASLLPAHSAAEVRRWVGWGGATLLPSGKRAPWAASLFVEGVCEGSEPRGLSVTVEADGRQLGSCWVDPPE